MLCENKFCIYWRNGHCCLEYISLDAMGRCREMVLVNLPETSLAKKRIEALSHFADQYKAREKHETFDKEKDQSK